MGREGKGRKGKERKGKERKEKRKKKILLASPLSGRNGGLISSIHALNEQY